MSNGPKKGIIPAASETAKYNSDPNTAVVQFPESDSRADEVS